LSFFPFSATVKSVEPFAAAAQKGHLETLKFLLSLVDTNLLGPSIPGRPKLDLNDPVTALYTKRNTVLHFVMEVPNFRASQRNIIKKLTEKQQPKNPQVKKGNNPCFVNFNSIQFRTSTKKKKRPRLEAACKLK